MLYFIIDLILSYLFKLDNYGDRMQNYIISHEPKTTGDVERLEREYVEMTLRGFIQ